MKISRRLLTAVAVLAFAFSAGAADQRMPIDGALKIAKDYLKERGAAQTIVALTLENATLRGESYWFAKWASPILGGDKPELGLRIGMNGEVSKIVGGGAAPSAGPQRVGARNIR